MAYHSEKNPTHEVCHMGNFRTGNFPSGIHHGWDFSLNSMPIWYEGYLTVTLGGYEKIQLSS